MSILERRSIVHVGIPSLILLALLAQGRLQAQTDTLSPASARGQAFTEEKINQIEENLVRDLESTMPGVVIGGVQTVREMKKAVPAHDFAKLIIPLMRIVKDENSDRAARILSALALDEINSERGNFAIAREGEMAKDEVFKSLCANLAKARAAIEKAK